MTYYEAIEIKQDLIVNMQYANVFHKEASEALIETAEKYTPEEIQEAYSVIREHIESEIETLKELFGVALGIAQNKKK